MKIVRTLRRIQALQNGYARASRYAERFPETDIDFLIGDKLNEVSRCLREWMNGGDVDTRRRNRKQVKLACKIMGLDYLLIR